MPIALITIGLLLVVTGVRNTHAAMAAQLKQDVPPFLPWIAAFMIIGAAGSIPKVRPVANAFLALVILAMVLANGRQGLFPKLREAVEGGPQSANAVADPELKKDDSGGGGGGDAGKAAKLAMMFL